MKPNRKAVNLAKEILGCQWEWHVACTYMPLRALAREYLALVEPDKGWFLRRTGKAAPKKLAKKKGHAG